MSRKDYELIAAAIHRSRMAKEVDQRAKMAKLNAAAVEGVRLVAIDLAASLAADNPRFDRRRFLAACGFAE